MKSLPRQCKLAAATMLLACVGCSGAPAEPAMRADELANHLASATLNSESDVRLAIADAAASERAIIFVHVDWAFMETQRLRYAQFVLEFIDSHPHQNMDFYYIDCTPVTDGYAPLEALEGWTELQNAARTSLVHGWGELVWMERGRILHVEPIINFKSASHVTEKTQSLMPRMIRTPRW